MRKLWRLLLLIVILMGVAGGVGWGYQQYIHANKYNPVANAEEL